MGNDELIFVTITRFGTILFLIYAVSIFIDLYRYVMRLAAYNEARAHALALSKASNQANAELFNQYANILNAEKLEFGKIPSIPTDQLLKAISAIKGSAKEKTPLRS